MLLIQAVLIGKQKSLTLSPFKVFHKFVAFLQRCSQNSTELLEGNAPAAGISGAKK